MRSLALFALFPLAAVATLNGHCTGSKAVGDFLTDGICVTTTTCADNSGVTVTGACPDDPDDVKCCLIGLDGSAAENPCGGLSYCTWTANGCAGGFVTGDCPGGTNYKCCLI